MLIILAACLHDEQHGESADAAPSPPRTRRSLFAPYDRQVDVDKLQPSIAATVMLYVDNLPSLTAHVRLAQSSWTVLKEDARCVKLHKLQERNPLRSCNVYSRWEGFQQRGPFYAPSPCSTGTESSLWPGLCEVQQAPELGSWTVWTVCWLNKNEMCCVVDFELVCVFTDCFMQILLQVLRSWSWSRVFKKGLDNNTGKNMSATLCGRPPSHGVLYIGASTKASVA